MRGKPKPRKGGDLASWRSRQKRGAIMKPSTFDEILTEAENRGLSKERAKKVAGAAYWKTAEAKYKKAKK
jgi:hypothetical protein